MASLGAPADRQYAVVGFGEGAQCRAASGENTSKSRCIAVVIVIVIVIDIGCRGLRLVVLQV